MAALRSCCYVLEMSANCEKLALAPFLRLRNQGSYQKLLLCFANVYKESEACFGPLCEVMKSRKQSEAVATFYKSLKKHQKLVLALY